MGHPTIRFQGATVGLLALRAPPAEDSLDRAFLATQVRALWLSGLAALVLSLVAAWLIARQFLGPIRALATGARQIARGASRHPSRSVARRTRRAGHRFQRHGEMLAQEEEARRQWISDSSHELRTPIAVLRAEIEALQDAVRTADEQTLARLHRNVMQMGKLVDDLRQTLDRDNGQGDLERPPLDPLAVLKEARESSGSASLQAGSGSTRPTARTGAGWRIRGDAHRLEQVFANLLENSLRYTDPGGRLKVAATARDGASA